MTSRAVGEQLADPPQVAVAADEAGQGRWPGPDGVPRRAHCAARRAGPPRARRPGRRRAPRRAGRASGPARRARRPAARRRAGPGPAARRWSRAAARRRAGRRARRARRPAHRAAAPAGPAPRRRGASLGEPVRHRRPRTAARLHVGQRRAAPQRRAPGRAARARPRVARPVAAASQLAEPRRVHRVRPHREPVSAGAPCRPRRSRRARRSRDTSACSALAAPPGGVAPQVVDQRRHRDRAAGVEREPGQQPAQPQPTERDGRAARAVRPHLDGAEQPDPHGASLPAELGTEISDSSAAEAELTHPVSAGAPLVRPRAPSTGHVDGAGSRQRKGREGVRGEAGSRSATPSHLGTTMA